MVIRGVDKDRLAAVEGSFVNGPLQLVGAKEGNVLHSQKIGADDDLVRIEDGLNLFLPFLPHSCGMADRQVFRVIGNFRMISPEMVIAQAEFWVIGPYAIRQPIGLGAAADMD